MIKKGSHVKIHTFTGGCYNGISGVVTLKFVSSQDGVKDESWECISDYYSGWYRVKFDHPVHTGERFVIQDIFMPSELTII